MSNTTGTVVTFTAAKDVDVVLNPSRPSKAEALTIGLAYFEACQSDKAMDALLNEHGPYLVRRSLRAFSNYAARTGQKDVAKFAMDLREDIQPIHHKTAI